MRRRLIENTQQIKQSPMLCAVKDLKYAAGEDIDLDAD